MTLSSHEASKLRFQILRDLQTEPTVIIDSRFIRHIFGGFDELQRFAKSWQLSVETFVQSGIFRDDCKTLITWVGLSYPISEPVIILGL